MFRQPPREGRRSVPEPTYTTIVYTIQEAVDLESKSCQVRFFAWFFKGQLAIEI